MKKPIETVRRKLEAGFTLEKGQIWKTGETYVLIGDSGKRLVHYKMAKKLTQRGLLRHLATIESVQAFLKSHRAELFAKS